MAGPASGWEIVSATGAGVELAPMAGDGPEIPRAPEFAARARIGWCEEGLWVRAEVADTTPAESSEPGKIHEGDSVLVSLVGPDRSRGMVQWVMRPGRHGGGRARAEYLDYRTVDLQSDSPLPEARGNGIERPGGYVVEGIIPWSILGMEGKEGETLEAQVMVNDLGGSGARFLAWRNGRPRPGWMDYPVLRLSGASGKPSPVAVWGGLKEREFYYANVVATPGMAGRQVTLLAGGEEIARQPLALSDGGASAVSLRHAVPPPGRGIRELEVRVEGLPPAAIPVPDIAELRKALFLKGAGARVYWDQADDSLLPRARPSVFSGEDFPAVDYPDRSVVESLVGRVEVRATFIDRDGRTVSSASEPGRYGAIIHATSQHGGGFVAYQTLCRVGKGEPVSGESVQVLAAKEDPEGIREGRTDAGKMDRDWWHRVRTPMRQQIVYETMVRLPEAYHESPDRLWPVIYFLHGSGDGPNLEKLLRSGPLLGAAQDPQFPFLIVTFRSPGGWFPPAVSAAMERVASDYRVDPARQYLTGFSMGGHGTWMVALDQPGRFAAIAPLAGSLGGEGTPERLRRILHLPVWVINGEKDHPGRNAESRQAAEWLADHGGKAFETLIPKADHLATEETAYRWKNLYQWFLSHSKNGR